MGEARPGYWDFQTAGTALPTQRDRGGRTPVPLVLAALLFLAGLGIMAKATVADEDAFTGWLFLLAMGGVVGAAVGL